MLVKQKEYSFHCTNVSCHIHIYIIIKACRPTWNSFLNIQFDNPPKDIWHGHIKNINFIIIASYDTFGGTHLLFFVHVMFCVP